MTDATTHTWVRSTDEDKQVCVDCDTVRWERYQLSEFSHALYRVPGEASWRRVKPDCAAVAADKMRTDQ